MDPDFGGAHEVVVGDVVLPDGATIGVVAEDFGGSQDVGVLEALHLEQVSAAIESIAAGFQEAMTKIEPKRGSVEFGIKIAAKSGKLISLLADGSGEATLTVKLEWGE